MSGQDLIVAGIVIAAALFATWRLAGPSGRQRILRGLVGLFTKVGAHAVAARIAAVHDRLAVAAGGSPCSHCGPDAPRLHLNQRK